MKSDTFNDTIDEIVADQLCNSCGTCVYVCPQGAIMMKETIAGLLHPKIDEVSCNYCGICVKMCPGKQLITKPVPHIDPFKGTVLAAYCGQATNSQHLKNGQSGGIATALLCHLLDTNIIEKAIVTEMPLNGSLKPVVHLTGDKVDLIKAQGSKYCPVPLNAFLPALEKWRDTKFAVVGLPCHFHGINNIISVRKNLQRPLLIGLICDRILTFAAIDYLVEESRIDKQKICTLKYRDKMLGGWPGKVGVTLKSKKTITVETKHRMWCKGIFTPYRCYLCFDKMNQYADIVLGDSWGIHEAREGASIILTRTKKGHEVIEAAINTTAITVKKIDPELVFRGQHIEEKRKDWTAFNEIRKNKGMRLPDCGIQEKWNSNITDTDISFCVKKLNKATYLTKVTSRRKLLMYAKLRYYFSLIKRKVLCWAELG